jgi:hypothetical protein
MATNVPIDILEKSKRNSAALILKRPTFMHARIEPHDVSAGRAIDCDSRLERKRNARREKKDDVDVVYKVVAGKVAYDNLINMVCDFAIGESRESVEAELVGGRPTSVVQAAFAERVFGTAVRVLREVAAGLT